MGYPFAQALVVVHKCFNPACSVPFLYLHQGKLFRVDTRARRAPMDGVTLPIGPSHIEFFWLCDQCARTMAVRVANGRGVLVRKSALAYKMAS